MIISHIIAHKHMIRRVCLLVVVCSWALTVLGQEGTISGSGNVNFNPDGSVQIIGQKTFISHISTTDEDVDRMLQLDAISLFRRDSDLSGGIKANVMPGGLVTLSLYSLGINGGLGGLLYQVTLTNSSTESYGGTPIDLPFWDGTAKSNNIKALLRNADTYLIDRNLLPFGLHPNLQTATIDYIHHLAVPFLRTPLNTALQGNNYRPLQPVIIKIDVTNATIMAQGIKVPGLNDDFDLANYFDPSRRLSVKMYVNNILKATYTAGNRQPQPLNLIMGDSIHFEVQYNGVKSPRIEGVPEVWIARFAGDLMYYCSPNVQPGEFSPWIGYDSRVHNMQLRAYAGTPDFRLKVKDWSKKSNIWQWGTVAHRQMEAAKDKYEAAYTWPKYKTLKGGIKQRNNQREGLNIQFLDYWQNGLFSDFSNFRGNTLYMMGFDDDELFYLNSQYHDAIVHPPLAGGGIAKLDKIPSRFMPEGSEQLYDISTGYPAQGFPLNIIISAYKMNREAHINHNNTYFTNYDGYEIQDIGTDEHHPFGTGQGNVSAPGTIKIYAGGQVVTFKINVKSPLQEDKGFYGSLQGNTWPAYYEQNNRYTLTGLKSLPISELDKFFMTYEGSDALGNLQKQTVFLKDLSAQRKQEVANTGSWSAEFDNSTPTYACITAYYRRTPTSTPVIVNGKELKSIFLLFFGESNLEGKGLGAKIWLNDFRTTKTPTYKVPRKFGQRTLYMTDYVREYTFHVGETTTFEAWDGDPHLFYDSGIEWFLSSRTLAERIPDSYLDGTAPGVKIPYLRFYINGIEQTTGRSGKKFTHTWKHAGDYVLKVVYRTDGGLTSYQHKIKIVDYPPLEHLPQLGTIRCRNLTDQEIRYLGIADASDYRAFEVTNVYSSYMYKSGPRACVPFVNRWADHNDYAAQYSWTMPLAEEANKFINEYSDLNWFWHYWALHYSSNWRDNMPYGLPPYVPNDEVTRINGSELDDFSGVIAPLFDELLYAKWQRTIPLVSYTDFQGNRLRTNPSCIYDLYYMWNNSTGAFSGHPVLPPDPSYIQAPDITDEQKDRQELYYNLKSGKLLIYHRRRT